jgi:hypothetical protein
MAEENLMTSRSVWRGGLHPVATTFAVFATAGLDFIAINARSTART